MRARAKRGAPTPDAAAPTPRVRFVYAREAWDVLLPEHKAALLAPAGAAVRWTAQRTAVTSELLASTGVAATVLLAVARGIYDASGVAVMVVADGVRQCRACGCLDDVACADGCAWVAADLCSACGPAEGAPHAHR